jgi:hypothetical protein
LKAINKRNTLFNLTHGKIRPGTRLMNLGLSLMSQQSVKTLKPNTDKIPNMFDHDRKDFENKNLSKELGNLFSKRRSIDTSHGS